MLVHPKLNIFTSLEGERISTLMWEKYQLSPGHFVILLPSGTWGPIGGFLFFSDNIFCMSLVNTVCPPTHSCNLRWIFSFNRSSLRKRGLTFASLFPQWKEDWGEISICVGAEFMNYIVRPMNKQTLMCFNFAGTKINLDIWFPAFAKLSTEQASPDSPLNEVLDKPKCLWTTKSGPVDHWTCSFANSQCYENFPCSRPDSVQKQEIQNHNSATFVTAGCDLGGVVLTHISHLPNGPWHNGQPMVSGEM